MPLSNTPFLKSDMLNNGETNACMISMRLALTLKAPEPLGLSSLHVQRLSKQQLYIHFVAKFSTVFHQYGALVVVVFVVV